MREAHPLQGSIREFAVDVTDEKRVKEILYTIEDNLGPIDLAILNAGTYLRFGVAEFSVKSFSKQWNINVMGTVNSFVLQ